jgi:hypothetical protein
LEPDVLADFDEGQTVCPRQSSSCVLIHPAPADLQQGRDVVDRQEFMKLLIALVLVGHISLLTLAELVERVMENTGEEQDACDYAIPPMERIDGQFFARASS